MISRPTLIAALVVVELAIVGVAVRSVNGFSGPTPPSFGFTGPGQAPSQAATALDHTFITGPRPRVNVDIGEVDIRVETGTMPTVRAVETIVTHGMTSGKVPPLVATQTPDGLRILPTGGGPNWSIGMAHELRLIVPPGTRLQIASAGTIDVTGLRDKLVAHTSEGHVHVHDQQGDVDVTTDDGQIELVDVQGNAIDAISHDGRIYLTRVGADRIDAHSDYGRIVGAGVRVVNGALTTHDGKVQMTFTPSSDAIANVSTTGDITVSGFSSVDVGDNRRTVKLGSGRGHVDVSTDGGDDITITPGANG